MSRLNKLLRWALYGTAIVFAILIVAVFAVPRLVNLEVFRDRINIEASRAIKGEVRFEKIKLELYPLPHLSVYNGRLSIPKITRGKLKALSVYPKIIPLLSGNIKIDKLTINRPEFDIVIPGSPVEKAKDEKQPPGAGAEEKIAAVIGWMQSVGEDLNLSIKDGRLNLSVENMPVVKLENVHVALEMLPERIWLNLGSGSNFYEKIALQAEIDLKSLKSRGRIELSGFNPQQLSATIISPNVMQIGKSQINLNLQFHMDRLNVFRGEVQGTIPELSLQRGSETVLLKAKNLKGDFYVDEHKSEVTLAELRLNEPAAILSGRFVSELSVPRVAVQIDGKQIDVQQAGKTALALAGDIPVVKAIFDILKGGRVPAIRFAVSGKTGESLGVFENMTIDGSLSNGIVSIPVVDFTVKNAGGEVKISKGLLGVSKINAVYDQTEVKDGSLMLGFSGKSAPFQLNIKLDADLGQVPGVIKRFVADQRVIAQLNRISHLSGRAQGSLFLGDKLDAIGVKVKISDFNLKTRVDPIAFPLELKGKNFSFEGTSINVRSLTVNLKNSHFFTDAVNLQWGEANLLQVDSGNAQIRLDQIRSLLLSFEGIKEKLTVLKSLAGTANISNFKMKGPLSKPASWRYNAAGSLQNVVLTSERLPAALSLTSGHFNIAPETLTFSEIELKAMDASLNISGRLNGYRQGVDNLMLDLRGKAGEQADLWLLKQLKLPDYLLIRPPLRINRSHLTWERSGKTTVSGDLNIHRDLDVSGDVQLEPGVINVKKFVIRDKESRAEFALNLQQKKIGIAFNGNLLKTTVDKFLADNQIFHGWIKGDLRLDYYQENPMNTVFRGSLSGKDFVLLKQLGVPIHIERVSIEGKGNRFLVASDARLLEERKLKLKGDLNYSPEGIVFNAEASVNGIVLDRLTEEIRKIAEEKNSGRKDEKAEKKEKLWNFPLHGKVKIISDYLKYQKYEWSPFVADISLHPERINMSVIRADVCGISTPGMVSITPQGVDFLFNPYAQEADFQKTTVCLVDQSSKVTGSFNFIGELNGRGAAEDLLNSIEGNFELKTGEGRILSGRSFRVLRDILALVNITEVYKGKLPSLTQEGFGYNSIRARGRYKNSSLVFEEGYIDGLTMNVAAYGEINFAQRAINLQVLVAPLKAVDSILGKIPLVGYLLGGSLITIPVTVEGNLDNPNVKLLSPSAVGEGLVGILKRTLQLPVKIFEPVVPK